MKLNWIISIITFVIWQDKILFRAMEKKEFVLKINLFSFRKLRQSKVLIWIKSSNFEKF